MGIFTKRKSHKFFYQRKYFEELDHIYNVYGEKEAKNFKQIALSGIEGIGETATMSSTDCLNYLVDYLLGPGWYAMDTGSQEQCNPIILDEIMKRYKGW